MITLIVVTCTVASYGWYRAWRSRHGQPWMAALAAAFAVLAGMYSAIGAQS